MSGISPAPQAESALESGGYAKGVATALVTQNRDPQNLGRVKLRFPWEGEQRESDWARIAVPMAGSNRGTYFLPEIGDEVLVAFERGDMRFPYVIGALWNGKDTPPASNQDANNDVRVIKSRSGHTLTFNDGEQGQVELRMQNGKRLSMDDQTVILEDGQGSKISIQSSGISIETQGSLSLKASTVSVNAQGTASLQASATMTIRGTLVQIN